MPYKILEDIAIADACYELTGNSLSEIFHSGFLALSSCGVELDSIEPNIEKELSIGNSDLERLLYDFLEEIIFFKDAEFLVFKECDVKVVFDDEKQKYALEAKLFGREFDDTIKSITDVKAMTYYQLYVKEIKQGKWEARVTFDL